MVTLMMNTVNRIYHILRSVVYKIIMHYIYHREMLSTTLAFSYAHTPLFCNTLPKQNEIFCLVNLLSMGGFFGCAGFKCRSLRLSSQLLSY